MALPRDFSEARFQRTFEADAVITNPLELLIYLAFLHYDQQIPKTDFSNIANYCLQWLASPGRHCAGRFLWVQYTNTESDTKPTRIRFNWAKARVLDTSFDRTYGYEVGTISCFDRF